MSPILLAIGLLLFISLVVLHEAGHFWLARRSGVEVEEFGIFFPPKLIGWTTKAGWQFTINLIPLGGFVRLKGEHDSARGPHTYGSARLGAKVKILLAGVGMNLLIAIVMMSALAATGIPELFDGQFSVKNSAHIVKNEVLVGDVVANSPASKIGLQSADDLLAIGPKPDQLIPITSDQQLPQLTSKFSGQSVWLKYEHNKQVNLKQLTLSTNPAAHLGVLPTTYTLVKYGWAAPVEGVGLVAQYSELTFKGIGSAVAGLGSIIAGAATNNHVAREAGQTKASNQLYGPYGIYKILKSGTLLGYQYVLFFIAYISLALAIMNVLPIPVLDGGKLYVTLISRALKKTLTEKAEAIIYGTSFALILGLVILITIVDVQRH